MTRHAHTKLIIGDLFGDINMGHHELELFPAGSSPFKE
jgi:hypothetical protein